MSRYTVRVELHGADEDDYQKLYEEMYAEGFIKTIEAGDGTVYDLPDAEYNIDSEEDINSILNKAIAAAKIVKAYGRLAKDASILVTKSAGRRFSGLNVSR